MLRGGGEFAKKEVLNLAKNGTSSDIVNEVGAACSPAGASLFYTVIEIPRGGDKCCLRLGSGRAGAFLFER